MKTCKQCNSPFVPFRPMQTVCGPLCAQRYVKSSKKAERENTRKRKEAVKSISVLIKEAQVYFNSWVRERDKNEPCISCGRHHTGQYHAGHFRSTGAASHLRFTPDNVWKQCQPCNTHLSGNLLEYRRRLIDKIGLERVEALENNNTHHHWTREELREIKELYKKKLKELQK